MFLILILHTPFSFFFQQILPAVLSRHCSLNAEETLKAVLQAFLQLQGRLSDVYPALRALGLAAGMAASALNLNGLGVMNRSIWVFLPFKKKKLIAAQKLFDWTGEIFNYNTLQNN